MFRLIKTLILSLVIASYSLPCYATNTAGGIKIGMIYNWSGSIASMPAGSQLSDGSNGSPNLKDYFVIGAGNSYAVGATGGTNGTHVHTLYGISMAASVGTGTGLANVGGSYSNSITYSIAAGQVSVAASVIPPYYSKAYAYTTVTGGIPNGGIVMWSGTVASIPTGFALCNGSNGTENLRNKFMVGSGLNFAVNAFGGSATHGHTWTMPFTGVNQVMNAGTYFTTGPGGFVNRIYTADAVATLSNLLSVPPFYTLAYIQNISGGTLGSYTGMVALWSGSVASIPSGWTINNNLKDKFVVGADSDQGGVPKTNVTGSYLQTGGSTTHSHGISVTVTAQIQTGSPGVIANSGGSMGASGTGGGGGQPPVASSNMPLYYALAYITKL